MVINCRENYGPPYPCGSECDCPADYMPHNGMTLNEYQEKAAKTAIYPGKNELWGLSYVIHGLCGEAGELSNKFKKVLRDHNGEISQETMDGLRKEYQGVLWYCSQIATELKTTMEEMARQNLEILESRAKRGVIKGNGDER